MDTFCKSWKISSSQAKVFRYVAAVERLPALHYSVDFIFLSIGIMGFIVELWNYQRVTDEA